MSSVKFINTFYYPDPIEQRRLERIQDEIESTRIFIMYDSKDKRDYNVRKYLYHKRMRERIKLVKDLR